MGKGTKIAVSAVLAAGAGYVAGLLTAPKSGKETRKDISDAALKARDKTEVALKDAHAELGEVLKKANAKVASGKTSAKAGMDKAVEKAVVARNKAREVLSAVHDGNADDKELQKAVDEVNDALAHLKKFMKS
ncbi:hypothetical protein CR970_02250 [Candidatus Saccharibacteria bacterium]|nr:MAG: hypothetical protein CR970_02250 [Candidatus Saccharibacteria bacterium]